MKYIDGFNNFSINEGWFKDKQLDNIINEFFDKIIDWETYETFNTPDDFGKIKDYKKCTVIFKDGKFSFFVPYFFRGSYKLERENGYGFIGDTREVFDIINNSDKKEKLLKQLYSKLKSEKVE